MNDRRFFFFFLLVHDDFSRESDPRTVGCCVLLSSRALKIMQGSKCDIIHDAVKSHLTAFWIILSVSLSGVRSQEGKKKTSLLQSLKSLTRVLGKIIFFALQA